MSNRSNRSKAKSTSFNMSAYMRVRNMLNITTITSCGGYDPFACDVVYLLDLLDLLDTLGKKTKKP